MAVIKEFTNYDGTEVIYPVTVAQAVYVNQNQTVTQALAAQETTADQTYVKKSGDTISGDLVLDASGTGETPAVVFKRGTDSDGYDDWRLVDNSSGAFKIQRRSGSSAWNDVASFTNGQVAATTFSGNATSATTATTANNVQGVAGTANTDRHVWFSDTSPETKRNYDDNFKYNPSTNVLTVGSITGSAAKVNNHTVLSDVPANAKFTDTTYSIATQSANGLLSSTDKKKLDYAALEWNSPYSVQNNSYIRIKINSTGSWMMSFTVNIYAGYNQHRVQISGYNYATTKTWYSPKAQLLSSTSLTSVDVVFAKDGDNDLSVYLPCGGGNCSVLIADVVYANITKTADLFTLSRVTEVPTENVTTVTAKLVVQPGDSTPNNISTTAAVGTSALYSRQDHTHAISLATGDANGQVKIAGTNVSVKGLAALAYKDSLSKSDIGLGNVDNKSSATIRGEITSSNVTTALGYTPVNKAGDTMSSSLNITKDGETGVEVNNTAQSHKVGFIVGSSGNAGIYDRTKSKWVVYSTTAGDVVLNGNANTATTATNVQTAAGVTNADRHVWFSDSATETKRNHDDNFKYNPSTNVLTVGSINGSATLTGTPTAPTADTGTNNTQIATTEFVKTAVDNFAANGTIDKATTLETPRTIDGVAFNGSANVTHFGVCSTNAETAEKTVACNNFSLDTGQVITVKFTTTNTAQTDITLNVNSTGAKAVKYRNNVAPSSSLFVAGRTYQFVYDGEAYQLVGDIDSNIDSKVMQSLSTEDVDHPVLFSYTNKNDTTADINNGSYRSNSIYANPQTGTLTATTLKGYLDGNAKSATVASFLNPTDSNTTYGSSTERGTITDGVVVFGESFRNTVDFVNEDESMISDSGDITMWMKQEADDDVRLNMSIDGDYYAHKDQPIAKLSEVVTLNGDQTVLGYKTFPGATFTNDTRWETGNYGFMIRNDGESTWFLLTAEGDPTGSWETPHPIRIKHDNHEVYFGSPVTAHQGITGSLTGHASLDVPISTGFGQNLSGYASSNDNTISGTVVRYSSQQATGKPTGTDHALFQMAYSDIWKTQLAQDWRTNKAYIRNCNNGTWGDWNALVSKGNIVYGRGNLNSNGTFDANGNVTLEDYGYGSNISVGQVATKPFLRFAYMNAGGASWYDCSIICLIDRGYNGGEWGIFKACIRTNNNSDSSAFSASGAEVQWLVRDGIPTDAIQIGLHSQFQNNYASLFYKITSGYQGARITVLSQNHRGSIGRRWTFQDCSEDNNGNGTECYASIAAYSSALSTIVAGSDVGYANTARYGENVYVSNRRGSGASGRIPLIIDGGISGTDNAYRRPYTIQDDIGFHYRPGTQSSSTGYAYLQLGNNIAYTGGNGTRGLIRLYGNNSYFTDILAPDSNANRTIYLPNRGGRIFTTEMFSLSGTTLTISTS